MQWPCTISGKKHFAHGAFFISSEMAAIVYNVVPIYIHVVELKKERKKEK